VEWDWLNFFYNVSSEQAPNFTTYYEIFDLYWYACGGYCDDDIPVSWADLDATSLWYHWDDPQDPTYIRFHNTGLDWGVAD
jgi:hypothetical protein